jgi:imidazoleglycerol phosphate synthase glutamine amidotransferase subunit HisH
MILILDINKNKTEFLNRIFDLQDIEYKYSLAENDIFTADKIILPHPFDLTFSYRRMNLMNLFSVLRIIKIPILGINDGFRLMCRHLTGMQRHGLGFFDLDTNNQDKQESDQNINNGCLSILKATKLLDKKYDSAEIYFNAGDQPLLNLYSTFKIKSDAEDYSFICENKNYCALSINTDLNEEICRKVILNFISM